MKTPRSVTPVGAPITLPADRIWQLACALIASAPFRSLELDIALQIAAEQVAKRVAAGSVETHVSLHREHSADDTGAPIVREKAGRIVADGDTFVLHLEERIYDA
jgi:hypothetical protein